MIDPYDFYTNNGLQRVYNNHGLASLDKGINIPNEKLGIGWAELTASVPLLVSYAPIIKAPEPSAVDESYDAYTKIGTGGLNISTFPMSSYYGEGAM